ncbi:hypothetical protein GGS20DRAFT_440289 [Poronia punctata]|nr:hypothetical protein GGS20DRAFT_440289 [Poronia punctata]
MQYKTLLLSIFVAAAAAKSIDEIVSEIPSCAKPCLDDASKDAGCDVDDHKCQCKSIDAITKSALVCLTTKCEGEDLKTASKVSGELCLAVAGKDGGDKITSAVDHVTSAAGGAFTSATGAAGSAFTSATGALTIQTSTSVSATVSPSPTGAANQAGAGIGMVGAAAMLALAL